MKILLAVDGSSASHHAVEEVAHRPWPTPSIVRVVCAVRPYVPAAAEFIPAAATLEDLLREQRAEAERLVTQAGERIAAPGLTVETVVRDGDPRTAIVGEAEDWGADLIVVGSHGRSGLTRLLLGSVAQAVVAHATCSVQVVRRRRVRR
jgi:nucleotide-binding universal stress UspA family protein